MKIKFHQMPVRNNVFTDVKFLFFFSFMFMVCLYNLPYGTIFLKMMLLMMAGISFFFINKYVTFRK